jgi:hypothetical protein
MVRQSQLVRVNLPQPQIARNRRWPPHPHRRRLCTLLLSAGLSPSASSSCCCVEHRGSAACRLQMQTLSHCACRRFRHRSRHVCSEIAIWRSLHLSTCTRQKPASERSNSKLPLRLVLKRSPRHTHGPTP